MGIVLMITFTHPFTMMVAGPSGCGKTTFIEKLLSHNTSLIRPQIKKVIWCNAERSALPSGVSFKNIEYLDSIPDEFINSTNEPTLIILDDMMLNAFSRQVCELFTKGSHHRNFSVVLVTQNIFHQGKFCRDISLNCKYLVVFKNPRDKSQFIHLAKQVYPENSSELLKIYKDVTQAAHNYLLIDLTQDINEILRFRTDIFNTHFVTCYCSSNNLSDKNGVANETIKGQQTYLIRSQKC